MNVPKLILVDFDRTLLKPEFYATFIDLLAAKEHIPAATADDIKARLRASTSVDLLGVIREAGLGVVGALELVRTELNPDDFLYPDVPAFLERHLSHKVVIMTTGNRQWQTIKLDFCASLRPYPKIILADNKGEYIRDMLMAGPRGISIHDYAGDWFNELVLIDDRESSLAPLADLPRVTLYHLARSGAKYSHAHSTKGITRVTSLTEVK
jgi:hypothetical protein